ncbi:hypothetical protein MNEG_12516 [Monoraphidium neglectum]|uniref:Protein kinase domain-containing protein n=1 Tax=Monoraphidium neglectum TaxID=145388 RepID=A0A0D2LV22_9CHLO|nr:hypothetical protein MNEG_12516 [Monoraphidium neglectum]KIY95444.1 hypothetical protein MNEG_12516 [Monoraphidium neglectum]|eukprot:XP_013894464.1 hypothetical protein MNEG_12516 [Monoraphidium neglectum]
MRGVLDVLCECHRRSFAYGDVKPANFLVCPDCDSAGGVSVRAVDFGCSRPVPLTQPCGSPLFMAPEMAGRRFGTAVDVWAAGVMLHILLVGRPPFWSNKSAEEAARLPAYAIVAATRTHDISYPRSDWGRLSREARQLVEAMLTRDPAARITAGDALAHPWFDRALGFSPARAAAAATAAQAEGERGAAAAAEAAIDGVVTFGQARVAAAACA